MSGRGGIFSRNSTDKFSKSEISEIGKEFPYIQKVEILVRKSLINFQSEILGREGLLIEIAKLIEFESVFQGGSITFLPIGQALMASV